MIHRLKGLLAFHKNYKENGFAMALLSSNEIAIEINIESILFLKKIIHRKNNLRKMIPMR